MKKSRGTNFKPASTPEQDCIAQAVTAGLRPQARASIACALSLGALFSAAGPLQAATYTVTNTTDAASGSLRAAILSANANADADNIVFDTSVTGSITLTSGQLPVSNHLTITGPGASTLAIDGNNSSRVFRNTSVLTISGLTITGGNAPYGGGIVNNNGTLTVTDSTITGNTSINGGGVFNYGRTGGTATVTINNSTVTDNITSNRGGGIFNYGYQNGTALSTINNSTLSANAATDGGGIFNYVLNNGTANVTINNSTISGNTAINGGGIYNDGYYGTATVALKNTIIANQASGDDCYYYYGDITSIGYNIDSDDSCELFNTGDQPNTDPLLEALADNGGPTFTHALLDTSPAIDAIPAGINGCGTNPVTDQRGETRPQDGNGDGSTDCDTGAYERMGAFTTDTGLIGDFVWQDTDGDGVQDAGEPGLEGVSVNLWLNCTTDEILTTSTDSEGAYRFEGLASGSYQLEFVKPAGYSFSPQNATSDFLLDSNPDPLTGLEPCLFLGVGNERTALDAGLIPDVPDPVSTGVIGDFVWQDTDGDGVQDAGEPGVPGVTVNLRVDCATNDVLTTTTDSEGAFRFEALASGNYQLAFIKPAGYSFSPQNATSDFLLDSNPDPLTGLESCRFLDVGKERLALDAGLIPDVPDPVSTGVIGDFVWQDTDGDGVQDAGEPGVPGVTVNLRVDCATNDVLTTTTDSEGAFRFEALASGNYQLAFIKPAGYSFSPQNATSDFLLDSNPDPLTGLESCRFLDVGKERLALDAGLIPDVPDPVSTGVIGDFVWQDTDGDGVQDAGEPGVPGVTVNLRVDCATNDVLTTTTDSEGAFRFEALASGNYQLAFIKPAGYSFSPQNATSDFLLDSNPDPLTGLESCRFLDVGKERLALDAGLIPDVPDPVSTGVIGDFVWQDTDGDGVQDAGEPGVPGVTVNLRVDCATNDVLTTTTDSEGAFRFEALASGNYQLTFIKPAGFSFSPQNATSDFLLDSNPDPLTGLESCRFLDVGKERLALDAGLIPDVPDPVSTGVIGDFVWQDTDGDGVQDAGEPGVPGVTVNLRVDCATNDVLTTTTDSEGAFRFEALASGNYQLTFIKPAGFSFSPQNGTSDFLLDSNPDPLTGLESCRFLDVGKERLALDAGLIPDTNDSGLSVQNLTVNENAGTASIMVKLTPQNAQTVSVRYATKPGTAIPGEDFRGRSGTLVFNPGQTSKTISVPILNNNIPESTENFIVNLFDPVNAGITDNQATVTILDDDGSSADAVSLVKAIYYSSDNTLWIKASSDAVPDGSAIITATIITNGVERVLGTVGWRASKDFYQRLFTNINQTPDTVVLTSNKGGSATGPIEVR